MIFTTENTSSTMEDLCKSMFISLGLQDPESELERPSTPVGRDTKDFYKSERKIYEREMQKYMMQQPPQNYNTAYAVFLHTKVAQVFEFPRIQYPWNYQEIHQFNFVPSMGRERKETTPSPSPKMTAGEYDEEIFDHLSEKDISTMPSVFDTELQYSVDGVMRMFEVEFLFVITQRYGYSNRTYLSAVNYFDRFITKRIVPPGLLRTVSAACFLIAAKFNEQYGCLAKGVALFSDVRLTQLDAVEKIVLDELDFHLGNSDALNFLYRYSSDEKFIKVLDVAQYLALLSTYESRLTGVCSQLIACSSLYLARVIMGADELWTEDNYNASEYEEDDFFQVVAILKDHLSGVVAGSLFMKYTFGDFSSAAAVARDWALSQQV